MDWKDFEVLITGGGGFIGSNLVERLIEKKANITVADDFRAGSLRNLERCKDEINLLQYDIDSLAFIDLIKTKQFDYIFHFASNAKVGDSVNNPMADFNSTLSNTLKLLDLLRNYSINTRLLFPSSAAVYGNPKYLPISEDDPTVPISPYGVAKLSAERYLTVFSKLYGIKGCSLRCFSVYGPRQKKLVVYDIIKKLFETPYELSIYGDGKQERDFIYISDLIDAFLITAENAKFEGEVYNVANERSYSIIDLARMISKIMGVSPKFVFGKNSVGDPDIWVASAEKIKKLGYIPKVDMETGINMTIQWVIQEEHINNPVSNLMVNFN